MPVFALLLALFVFASVPSVHAAQDESVYVCPMHPHVTGKKGDLCPICGMSLVPKVPDPAQEEEPKKTEEKKAGTQGALQIDPVYVQALGVKTAEATHRTFGKKIRAFGHISPDTREEYAVSVRTGGIVRNLETAAVGDAVKRGDLLFTLYSSELVVAQQDYLSRATAGPHRLRILGMDDEAIAQLDREKKVLYETPFHAPADGVVTALNVRKGSSIEEGEVVLTIQNFSQVWVEAQLPEKDLRRISASTQAFVEWPDGITQQVAIDYIAPELEEETRTGTVRLVLNNTEGHLRPGQYVDVLFATDEQARLSVPSASILSDGRGDHVIKALGDGYFSPVSVRTGLSADGYTEILSGLSHGDEVVENGQFLIDAESTLRGGGAQMHGPEMEKTKSSSSPSVTEQGMGGAHVH